MTSLKILAGVAVFVLGAAAPAFAEDETDTTTAASDPRIGEEVDRICFGRNINGWKEIKREDNVILLEEGVNHWYRVELAGACRYSVLRHALNIAIDSRPAGGCVTRGDMILVEDTAHFTQRCFITKINKWDHKAKAPSEDDEGASTDDSDGAE